MIADDYKEVVFDTLQDGDKFNRKIRGTTEEMNYFERQITGSIVAFADGISTLGETVALWEGDRVFVKIDALATPPVEEEGT